MSLRKEHAALSRVNYSASTMPTMRDPGSFTPPQQRAGTRFPRRGSLSLPSTAKEKPVMGRSSSVSCARLENSQPKLNFPSMRKPSSVLSGKLRSGPSKEAIPNTSEKHSVVVLGTGGVGKTGKLSSFPTTVFV